MNCSKSCLKKTTIMSAKRYCLARSEKGTHKNYSRHRMEKVKCSHCDLMILFYNKKRHENEVHRGLKPFACNFCSKTFSQKTSLQTHLRTHTGERPFLCKFCDNRYSDRSTLWKHLKKIHKDEEIGKPEDNDEVKSHT